MNECVGNSGNLWLERKKLLDRSQADGKIIIKWTYRLIVSQGKLPFSMEVNMEDTERSIYPCHNNT
jgi:hypothetical protein